MNPWIVGGTTLLLGGALGAGACALFGSSAELVNPSTAAGVVFEDLDGDGERDEGEPGIAGVSVLVNVGPSQVRVLTSTEGAYRIEMPSTRFSVAVDDTTLGFDARLTTYNEGYGLEIPPGLASTDLDFGYQRVEPVEQASASGTVFEDLDGDGDRDEGEPGIAGVELTVTRSGGATTVTTDADGVWEYRDDRIQHGVTVDTATLPFTGRLTTYDEGYGLEVPPGLASTDLDFGYQRTEGGSVSGVVFEDLDADGSRGDGEPGIAGVTVVLGSPDGTGGRATATTDADGSWTHAGRTGRTVVAVEVSTLPSRPDAIPSQTTAPSTYALDVTGETDRRDLALGFTWVSPATRPGELGGSSSTEEPSAPDEPSPTPTAPPSEEADACVLPGTWDLREQPFLDQIAALGAGQVPGGIDAEHVSGNYLITLGADGTYRASRNDWSFRIAIPEGALVVTIDADDSGTWEASGSSLSISEPAGQADVDFAIEQGGQRVPLPVAPPQTVGTDAISGTGSYVCRGDVLEVTFDGVTSTLDRRG